mmetsp:Transcript_38764/g.64411  ORF Transcript_38764/g.64411 Transcript_38764/m.64411 type:complete len:262 (-) Transcript_38764:146-931(-)
MSLTAAAEAWPSRACTPMSPVRSFSTCCRQGAKPDVANTPSCSPSPVPSAIPVASNTSACDGTAAGVAEAVARRSSVRRRSRSAVSLSMRCARIPHGSTNAEQPTVSCAIPGPRGAAGKGLGLVGPEAGVGLLVPAPTCSWRRHACTDPTKASSSDCTLRRQVAAASAPGAVAGPNRVWREVKLTRSCSTCTMVCVRAEFWGARAITRLSGTIGSVWTAAACVLRSWDGVAVVGGCSVEPDVQLGVPSGVSEPIRKAFCCC